jgi:hypothetical protein
LDIRTLKTIFGAKQRPRRSMQGSKPPRCEVAVEKPTYDLTVFKIHFRKQTLKVYTKGERVLRIEAITHNARDLSCGVRIAKFPVVVSRLVANLDRFLEALRCVDVAWISDGTFEDLPKPAQVGGARVAGLDLNKPRIRAVFEAIMALAPSPRGFGLADLADRVSLILKERYVPRQAGYDLKKLRAKELVTRRPRSRRYETTPSGLGPMAALLTLRDKVIKPLLASEGRFRRGPKPKGHGVVDRHYEAIQRELRDLFHTLGIAACPTTKELSLELG